MRFSKLLDADILFERVCFKAGAVGPETSRESATNKTEPAQFSAEDTIFSLHLVEKILIHGQYY